MKQQYSEKDVENHKQKNQKKKNAEEQKKDGGLHFDYINQGQAQEDLFAPAAKGKKKAPAGQIPKQKVPTDTGFGNANYVNLEDIMKEQKK